MVHQLKMLILRLSFRAQYLWTENVGLEYFLAFPRRAAIAAADVVGSDHALSWLGGAVEWPLPKGLAWHLAVVDPLQLLHRFLHLDLLDLFEVHFGCWYFWGFVLYWNHFWLEMAWNGLEDETTMAYPSKGIFVIGPIFDFLNETKGLQYISNIIQPPSLWFEKLIVIWIKISVYLIRCQNLIFRFHKHLYEDQAKHSKWLLLLGLYWYQVFLKQRVQKPIIKMFVLDNLTTLLLIRFGIELGFDLLYKVTDILYWFNFIRILL